MKSDYLPFDLDRCTIGRDEPVAEMEINAIPDYTEIPCPHCERSGGYMEDGAICPECCGVGILVQVWSVTIYRKGDRRECAA